MSNYAIMADQVVKRWNRASIKLFTSASKNKNNILHKTYSPTNINVTFCTLFRSFYGDDD